MSGLPITVGGGAGLDLGLAERKALGHMLGAHPLRDRSVVRRLGASTLAEAEKLFRDHRRVTVGAVPTRVWERRTKAGEWMAVVWLEDAVTRREAVCFPRAWDQCADVVEAACRASAPLVADVGCGREGSMVLESAAWVAKPDIGPPGPPLGDFAVVDIETTVGPEPFGRERGGLSKRERERRKWLASLRVVEVGVALFRTVAGKPGHWRRSQVLSRRVDPGCPVDDASRAIHGISDADVRGQPTFADRARKLADTLAGRQLVTYNGRAFDLLVLDAEFDAAGVQSPIQPADSVDLYDFAATRYRGRRDRPASKRLADQCAFHGVHTGKSHSAGDDAAATGDLLVRLVSGGWAPLGVRHLRAGVRAT